MNELFFVLPLQHINLSIHAESRTQSLFFHKNVNPVLVSSSKLIVLTRNRIMLIDFLVCTSFKYSATVDLERFELSTSLCRRLVFPINTKDPMDRFLMLASGRPMCTY